MLRKEINRRDSKTLSAVLILGAVLAACTPEAQPDVSQSIESADATSTETGSGSIIENAVPETTPTQEATATPERTEAENMHEYCIQRAREAGIDLENIDNSNNLWFSEIQGLEDLLEGLETSVSNDGASKTMLVVGIDFLNSQARYDQAPTTADGKKIMSWYEVIYKNASGQYQMALLPNNIWEIEEEMMWSKNTIFSPPQYFEPGQGKIIFGHTITDWSQMTSNLNPTLTFQNDTMSNYARQGYWVGPGAFINFDSDYPGTAPPGGAGMIEEPSYSEEQMLDFRSTGNTDFFPYFITDPQTGIKKPFIYPFVNYATYSTIDRYQNQTFWEELANWHSDGGPWQNPDGPPFPQHWQALP
jgi:hypothetical protein